MIDFQGISKSYYGEYILKDVSVRINSGEKVGVVGPNGSGKSTLFGIVTGTVTPDCGSVAIPKNHRLGIMRQHIAAEELDRTLLEFTADAIPELRDYSAELSEIELKLQQGDFPDSDSSRLLRRHGELQSTIEHLGAYHLDVEARQALSNLGFPVSSFDRKLGEFSGGWRMRAALARVLISHPDTLMLDEPSNYLDVPAVEWLCRFLNTFPGTLMLISHDRFLLRKLVRVIIEVNAGTVTRYPGGYDYYRTERESRLAHLEASKRNIDRKKEQMERVIERFRAKSTKAAQAKSWQKKLEKIEDVELPDSLNYQGELRFPTPPPAGVEAIRLEKISFGYSPDRLLFKEFDLTIDSGEKVAVIGFNGRGKSTLLKLMTGILKPLSGRVVSGHHTVIGYQAQEFSELLNDELTVYDAARLALPAGASTANLNNVLGSFGFSGEATKKPCGVLSGGERIRLQFARIFVNPPNFLILDEPTTHLDLAARELLQRALVEYRGTICFVSHDIEFVRNVGATVVALEENGPRKYFGNYDYYLEKSAAAAAANPVPAAAAPDPEGAVETARDRRRARAQARNALAGDLRRARERVAALEAELDTASEKRRVLIGKLSSGMKLDFATLRRELAAVEKRIGEIETEWESAAAESEALRQENERIHQELRA